MMARCRLRSEEGLTLVELLVVLTLLGVIGSIVSLAMARGLQADSQARDRLEAFESMQIAMERMSREIRGANDSSADHPLLTAEPDDIRFQVRRIGDECIEFRYELVGETLIASQRSSSDACVSFGVETDVVLLRGLDAAATGIFTYWSRERKELDPADPGFAITEIAFVEISFVRTLVLDQRSVTVSTVVGLRNR